MSLHKSVADLAPTVKTMSVEIFCTRHAHPFLFGREVLEEEFRFSTAVTDPTAGHSQDHAATAPSLRIRHWVIPVRKAADAPAQDRVFLGRSETNDVCVPHPTVSKLHAYFQRDHVPGGAKWFIVDAGSANGTKHNGMRLPPRAKVALLDSDVIVLGRCVFQWLEPRSMYERIVQAPA
jgi:hypothetical protein